MYNTGLEDQETSVGFLFFVAIGSLVLIAAILFFAYSIGQANRQSNLPECQNGQVANQTCVLTSTIRPQSVEALVLKLETSEGQSKCDKYEIKASNGISYKTCQFSAKDGYITLRLFDDALSLSFRKGQEATYEFGLQDIRLDGFVDVGRLGISLNSDDKHKVFKEESGQGLEHRSMYQKLYEEYFGIVAMRFDV